MSAERPGVVPVASFTLLYLLAATVWAVATGNWEFLYYIVVLLFPIAAVGWVHFRVGLGISLLWCLSAWGFLHMAGGLVAVPESWPIHGETPVLYSLWLIPERLKFDQVVHAFGFGTTTWLCWQAMRGAIAARLGADRSKVFPTFGLLVLCVAGGMGFGALNEVIEFFATLLVPETNVGGYFNTGWDLVANLVGAVAVAVLIRLANRKPTS
ncbi:MAG: hypothetical protein ACYTAF_04255 [Planctomycetota bacterium]|jgi:hypothetical protein